jgi:hypothetical protein
MVEPSKIKNIKELINELGAAFAELEGVDYKIIIESYDENDRYVIGAEDSNNWERSWC